MPINANLESSVQAIEAPTQIERAAALEGAHILLATGASGMTLLDARTMAGKFIS